MASGLEQWINRLWYGRSVLAWVLFPLSLIFRLIVSGRRQRILQSEESWQAPVPVLVIGNITVGGTGKTPLTIALVNSLKGMGWNPGIVSRGYGAKITEPQLVYDDSTPDLVGDEPLLIARATGQPVSVFPKRAAAARYLLTQRPDVDLILCDDGLQHYYLKRDLEVCVIDGRRGFGNGNLLPMGPLREPLSRLQSTDFIVLNGEGSLKTTLPHQPVVMDLTIDGFYQVGNGALAERPQSRQIHAVAGIGNPERFFRQLEHLGYGVIPHAFPDHHSYQADDIRFNDGLPVVMTEKDAVKCEVFAPQHSYFLRVKADLPESFSQSVHQKLSAYLDN